MTRTEMIAKHRHELGGMILDAVTTKLNGAELSLYVRTLYQKVDDKLGLIYDEIMRDIPDPIKRAEQKPNVPQTVKK